MHTAHTMNMNNKVSCAHIHRDRVRATNNWKPLVTVTIHHFFFRWLFLVILSAVCNFMNVNALCLLSRYYLYSRAHQLKSMYAEWGNFDTHFYLRLCRWTNTLIFRWQWWLIFICQTFDNCEQKTRAIKKIFNEVDTNTDVWEWNNSLNVFNVSIELQPNDWQHWSRILSLLSEPPFLGILMHMHVNEKTG